MNMCICQNLIVLSFIAMACIKKVICIFIFGQAYIDIFYCNAFTVIQIPLHSPIYSETMLIFLKYSTVCLSQSNQSLQFHFTLSV